MHWAGGWAGGCKVCTCAQHEFTAQRAQGQRASKARPDAGKEPAPTCAWLKPSQARTPWYSSHSSTPKAYTSAACTHQHHIQDH